MSPNVDNAPHPGPALESLVGADRGSLGETARDAIREAILTGALPPGTRLVEESIAKQMGVSRATLRQALWMLKRDGLIVDESARTTRVVTLDAGSVRELHFIRVLLESAAYQMAAKRITSDEIAGIEVILEQMQAAADAEDRVVVASLDYAFHRSLCEASGMPRLVEIWDQQQVLFRLWLNMVGQTLNESVDHIAITHRVILDAVLNGDPAEIFERVHEHVYLVGDALKTERRRWADEQPQLGAPQTIAPAPAKENRQ